MLQSFSFRALLLGALVTTACSSSTSDSPSGAAAGQAPVQSGGAGASSSGAGKGSDEAPGAAGAIASGGASPAAAGAIGVAGAQASPGGAPSGTGGAGPSGGASSGGAAPTAGRAGSTSGDVGTAGDGEIDVGPTYVSSPDLRLKAGAPAGFTVSFNLTSAMSKVFDGTDFTPALTFTRQIRVFVPQQYVDGTESPFMVSSDGFYAGLQTVVQNLADDPTPTHHVPPLVIIGIQNGPDVHPDSERSLEYDTVSDRYWRFVTTEVIPAALANTALRAKFPNFKLTSDPNGRGGYGCSSGGPAVMGLAWFGDFNRVLSFSGSYTALQPTTAHPNGAWEYAQMITAAPLRPDLRIFLEVGQNDNGSTTPDSGHRNWVTSNRSIAAALMAKGNHYRFIFAQGAGHCDNNARNQVMPEGLIWLWRGYKAN
jgi:iron(III)-enterobactin esterase